MAATFDDVINRLQLDNQQTIDQLEINNQTNVRLLSKVDTSIMMLSDRLGDFIEQFRLQQLDMLEALREGGGGSPFPGSSPTGSGSSGGGGGGGGFGLGLLPLGLAPALTGIAAGGTAVGASLAGLRGWEAGVVKSLSGLFKLPEELSGGLTKWFNTSSTGKMLKNLGASIGGSGVIKTGGAFLKLTGKILAPLGFLFSAFDAFQDWKSTEGKSLPERITSAQFAFVGDFIGAPLDLLKGGITYLYRNVMGLEVDENGKIKGDSITARVGRIMQEFSFEDTIKALPEILLSIVQNVNQMVIDVVRAVFPELIPSSYDDKIKSLRGAVRGYSAQAGGYSEELSAAREELGFITGDIAAYQGQLFTMGGRKSEIEAEIARLLELRETTGGGYRETRFGRTIDNRLERLGLELDEITGGISRTQRFLTGEQARLGPALQNVANLEVTVGRTRQQAGSTNALLVATEALKDAELAESAARGAAIINNTDASVTNTATNVFAGQTTAASSEAFEATGN